ncbi:MAG: peptidoglycan-binding domain-containing protein [Phycisphaerales bacterium]
MPVIVAVQGDSVVSLASSLGFLPETLWNHERNQSLHTGDRSPAVLHPGDELFVPPLTPRLEQCPTERKHRFRRRGVPSIFKIRFLFGGEPRKGVSFTTRIDNVHGPDGTLNDEGYADFPIPPAARTVHMTLEASTGPEEYEFAVGHLDPVSKLTGLKHRLNSLGYHAGEENEDQTQLLADAIRAFQAANGLEVSGEPDDATRDRLSELYEADSRS